MKYDKYDLIGLINTMRSYIGRYGDSSSRSICDCIVKWLSSESEVTIRQLDTIATFGMKGSLVPPDVSYDSDAEKNLAKLYTTAIAHSTVNVSALTAAIKAKRRYKVLESIARFDSADKLSEHILEHLSDEAWSDDMILETIFQANE